MLFGSGIYLWQIPKIFLILKNIGTTAGYVQRLFFFVVIGIVLMVFSILALPSGRVSPTSFFIYFMFGLVGIIGGIAALRGNRRLALLIYAISAVYLFCFPIGTILSIVIFIGLPRYLISVERLKTPDNKVYFYQ